MDKVKKREFKPNIYDIFLSVLTSIGMPIICGKLYNSTGALIPMLIYYVIFCWALVKWRKGSLDYRRVKKLFTPLFAVLLFLSFLIILSAKPIMKPSEVFSVAGFLFTLIVWVPVNAFSEQLSWLYVFDSFSNYSNKKTLKIVFTGVGLLFYTTFIALIHILFWAKFLMELDTIFPYWHLYIALHLLLTIGYILIYRRTGSMYPVAVIHLILDAAAVIGAKYSIIPYLLK